MRFQREKEVFCEVVWFDQCLPLVNEDGRELTEDGGKEDTCVISYFCLD